MKNRVSDQYPDQFLNRRDRSLRPNILTTRDARQIMGRLVAYGLDSELKESVYAVIDGVDGRFTISGFPISRR